jgi:hypothetical protein
MYGSQFDDPISPIRAAMRRTRKFGTMPRAVRFKFRAGVP